jgi:hypothetical protein
MSSMFLCPHCGKELDVSPRREVPWWKYDPGPTARLRLGCGTLFLIAIIVAVFSSRNPDSVEHLEQEVRALHEKLDGLDRKLEKLSPPAQRIDPPKPAP